MWNASNPTSRPLLTPESHFRYLPFRSSPFVANRPAVGFPKHISILLLSVPPCCQCSKPFLIYTITKSFWLRFYLCVPVSWVPIYFSWGHRKNFKGRSTYLFKPHWKPCLLQLLWPQTNCLPVAHLPSTICSLSSFLISLKVSSIPWRN